MIKNYYSKKIKLIKRLIKKINNYKLILKLNQKQISESIDRCKPELLKKDEKYYPMSQSR